jgi:isoquinoline 1-oxidoreductase subunit beta
VTYKTITYQENKLIQTMNNRRIFLKNLGLSSAGLILGFSASAKGHTKVSNLSNTTAVGPFELHPFIVIDSTGQITLINHRPDMGQGSWQAVPMLLAEELEVSLDQIKIKQSNGLGKYGNQLSGGSSTVRTGWKRLLTAGAAAREMFTQAAATRWGVAISECKAAEGKIHHQSSGKSLTYGELADDASKLEVPKNPKLKEKKDFKIVGKALPRPEIPSKVTGAAVFGMDVEVPGMVFACVEHSPAIFGKILTIDDTKAKEIKGVIKVIKTQRTMQHRNAESVAVIATNFWAALQGRKALKVTWDNRGLEQMTSEAHTAKLYEAAKKETDSYYKTGDIKKGMAEAAKKLEANYETPFLAHAPMEPEVAIAHAKEDGSCEIWAPVQGPDGVIDQVASHLGIAKEKVKVNVPFLGGGFGRKAYTDFVLEAVNISKEIKAPVKLIWTREDDITQGPFRPAMLSAMRGGVDDKGNIVAFEHRIFGESILGQVFKGLKEGGLDGWAKEGIGKEESPYNIPNAFVGGARVNTDIPILWWRSVYPSNTAFGHECFIDELAHAAQKDPIKARLEMMKGHSRFENVLQTLAEKSGWDKPLPAGKGKGIAIAKSFETICAHAVFVSKNGKGIKIDKVVSVIDCGMYVNPDNVKAQTEGNIVMGITAAIKDGITFGKNNSAEQSNFHQYKVLRINEMPTVEIHIIESNEEPGGAGEPGLPPVAPALCNAIFAATGKRIRKLPFDINNV